MARYTRDSAILAKIETTEGTDSAPTGGSNALLVSEQSIEPLVANNVPRELIRNYFGASEHRVGTAYLMVEFTVELQGSGTAATAPAWGALLRGCGFAESGLVSYAAYAPDTVERLADLGVQLIGIDTASIDPADSKALSSHQVIRRRGLRVLENLVLDGVPEGDYELIALPLKLTTADASPVRAILREL